MRRSYAMLLVTAVVLTLSSFASPTFFKTVSQQGKKYSLKYSPKKGTSGTMIMDYTMKIGMELMGQSMDMDQTMEMGAKMEITDNTGSEIMTNMSYDYFAMTMNNPMMGEMTYDSREEKNEGMLAEQMDGAFDEIIGKKISIVQDQTGKTLRAEGMEEMMGMGQSQGSLDFSSVMSMSQFPEKPIAIGETWSNVMDDASSPMKISTVMTLSNVKDGKVYVSFESDVTANDKFDMSEALEGTEAEGEEEPELDISGTQNGTFIYDQSTMWLIEGLINQDLSMKVEQMGMEIPMTIKGDMVLTME